MRTKSCCQYRLFIVGNTNLVKKKILNVAISHGKQWWVQTMTLSVKVFRMVLKWWKTVTGDIQLHHRCWFWSRVFVLVTLSVLLALLLWFSTLHAVLNNQCFVSSGSNFGRAILYCHGYCRPCNGEKSLHSLHCNCLNKGREGPVCGGDCPWQICKNTAGKSACVWGGCTVLRRGDGMVCG